MPAITKRAVVSLMNRGDMIASEPEVILNQYKQMGIECSNIAAKVHELNNEKEEHRLVVEQLSKLEDNRRAYRLVGGVLVEKNVNEVTPIVTENLEGVHCTAYLLLLGCCYSLFQLIFSLLFRSNKSSLL